MSVIIKLLSKFDDSGIRHAKKGFSSLNKTLGAVGIGLGLKQLTNGLMDAAKAASMDQKSTQLLNNQLKKNAGATSAQVKQNDKFIQSLSEQVGIVDDDLRPAQARLARATGSVSKSQELLRLALDASAVSGKPLATVSAALGKAFNGSTGALTKLFPELKKSKDMFGDLRKEVEGTAAQQADPFAKLNVAMDNLKEKLGKAILPILVDFIDTMMKPGGAIDQVGKLLDDVSNPKTEAGKTFLDIKKAVMETIGGVKDFFALFGNGDAMKGFANIATNLIKMLPALLALKGIMVLAQSATAIQNLIIAMMAIQGKNPIGNTPIGKASKYLIPAAIAVGTAEVALNEFSKPQTRTDIANAGKSKFPAYNPGMNKGLFVGKNGRDSSGNLVTNNVTINVQNADPKATVDALSKYLKQNGSLPFSFPNGQAGR
jgi:hypothetical protein